jgi:hypothetical protein
LVQPILVKAHLDGDDCGHEEDSESNMQGKKVQVKRKRTVSFIREDKM